MQDEAQDDSAARPPFLAALLERQPAVTGYHEAAQQARSLTHAFRQQMAERLQPALNAHIRTMPQDDLEGKKAVAEFINGELEPLGLAVRCPNSGHPARLKATAGNWPGVGSFHFLVYNDGKRLRPTYADKLPELQLMDAYSPPLEAIDAARSK